MNLENQINFGSQKSLKKLSAIELHEKLMNLVAEERKLTLTVLEYLRESEARRLYAERGHSSLFEYCVSELRYSESAAMRRISAMRALKFLPELREQVESGELKVTQLATLQSFVRMEAKAGKTYSVPETRALFQAACGKSTRETEKLLSERNPAYVTRETVRVVSPTQTQLTFTADENLMQEIQAVRDRFAHQLPAGATLADVVRFMAKIALAKIALAKTVLAKTALDMAPENRAARKRTTEMCTPEKEITEMRTSETPAPCPPAPKFRVAAAKSANQRKNPLPAPAMRSRYVPVAVKHAVWTRDQGICQFVSRITGKKCLSRHRLQVDHIVPFALGGSSVDPEGLRLLCFSHNQWEARRLRM